MGVMDIIDRKSGKQIELETKIAKLREAGMMSAAGRLESQLKCYLNQENRKDDKVKPMSMADQIRTAKAAKARM
jgi:hypothetical protein